MAINPDNITTIRVDQLANLGLTLDSLFPHTVGTQLTSSTIEVLVDLVATAIGTSSGVGFLAESRTDGQTLPDIPADPSFMLVGIGTFGNLNGYADLVCTAELNALMSVTDHWEIAVQIPISPLAGTVQSVTGTAVDNTDPLNPVINTTAVGVESIVAGDNITVDNTDPNNPIVSATANGFANTLWSYKAKTTLTTGDPLAGHMIWNNATQISATQLNLSHLVDEGFDIDLFFTYLNVGNKIIIQDKDDSTNNQIWEISSAVTIIPNSYVEVPVTLVSSSGTGTTNFANNHDVFVVNQSLSGGTTPNLEQVLTEGSTATDLLITLTNTINDNSVNLGGFDGEVSVFDSVNNDVSQITPTSTGVFNTTESQGVRLNKDRVKRSKGSFATDLTFTDPTANRTINFKDESGTVALLSDVTAPNLEQVLTEGETATDLGITLNNTLDNTFIGLDPFDGSVGVIDPVADEFLKIKKDLIKRAKAGFETDLTFTDPTANRTINFKDESGTVALLSDITGVSDGDKGDITVSSSGSVWTIDNGAVTLAKTSGVQETLVSGTNIKTINGTSILGSGDIPISGAGATQNARATRLELTSDINLPISATGSVSVIDFDNSVFNVDPTVFTNNGAGTITCTLAGNYLVTTSVVIESPLASAITKTELGIRKNGTNVVCATTDDTPIALGNNVRSLTTSTIINLGANDTLQAIINLYGASATGRALRLPALFGTTATQVSNISIERLEVSEFDVDAVPTDGSANAVSSNGVFDALALKADKSMSAYSIRANNTNATANATEFTFRQSGQLAYTDTPTFTATTAPSGATNLTYNWQQIGNMVTVFFTFEWATAGTAVSQIQIPMPTDLPNPVVPTGFTGANVMLYAGDGIMSTVNNTYVVSNSDMYSFLRRNSADNDFEFGITGIATNFKVFRTRITYPTS